MPPLRIALIGCGAVARKHHLPAYAALAESGAPIELACACDAVPANLGGLAVPTCADWREMIGRESIDAVDLCVPTPLHAEMATACLDAGLHVLCEKPMALNVEEADRMIAASERSGKALMVAMPMRFFGPYTLIAQLIADGTLGKPRTAYFTRSGLMPRASGGWMMNAAQSGGVILDVMIHDIDAALMLFGPPASASAAHQPLAGTAVPGSASARLAYGDGQIVTLIADWLPYYNKHAIRVGRVDFERGYVYFDAERKQLHVVDAEGNMEDRSDAFDGNMYANEIAYFADCVQQHAKPVRCPPEDSRAALAIAVALASQNG